MSALPDVAPAPVLDPRLDDLPFTHRIREMAAAKGVSTLRQLARTAPRDLVAAPHLLSATVEDARVILERFLGRTWEELAALSPPRPVRFAASRLPTGWDELRLVLPERLRAVSLEALGLPTAIDKHARTARLRTLGDLARC